MPWIKTKGGVRVWDGDPIDPDPETPDADEPDEPETLVEILTRTLAQPVDPYRLRRPMASCPDCGECVLGKPGRTCPVCLVWAEKTAATASWAAVEIAYNPSIVRWDAA